MGVPSARTHERPPAPGRRPGPASDREREREADRIARPLLTRRRGHGPGARKCGGRGGGCSGSAPRPQSPQAREDLGPGREQMHRLRRPGRTKPHLAPRPAREAPPM